MDVVSHPVATVDAVHAEAEEVRDAVLVAAARR
jgi:hypothetical protein